MNNVIVVMMMIIIGAMIGGATNFLAIRMLFRPYTPKYIGSVRLPFTPGLIPRRRREMATQLGHLVVQYLLTPDSMKRKIEESQFHEKIETWLIEECQRFLQSERSLSEVMNFLFNETWTKETFSSKTETMITEMITDKLHLLLQEKKEKKIKEVIPSYVLSELQSIIPKISRALTEKGAAYFRTQEGRAQLEMLLNKFLEGKGSMVNFVGTIFGSERIVDKMQPEIIRFFEDPSSEKMMRQFLLKEWKQLEEKPFEVIAQSLNAEKLAEFLTKKIVQEIPIYQVIDKPLHEWTAPYESIIIEKWLPHVTHHLLRLLSHRLVFLLQQFQLEEVVREEVDHFSVSRLEAMVLSIAKRELKMITYLGAMIGGVVGFIQGLFALLF